MNILVVGAGGFIGSHVTAGLIRRGHAVTGGVRDPQTLRQTGLHGTLACDLAKDHDPETWARRLTPFQAVVNAAGILRPTVRQSFAAVHVQGPTALWQGCEMAEVSRVVQISALGDPFLTEFIGSKHRGDELLMESTLNFTVLRPSVVHSPAASYGGTALLRALAGLPGGLILPGDGRQLLQPVCLADLVEALIAAVEAGRAQHQVVELVGPEVVTLKDYLRAYRQWLGRRPGYELRVPMAAARPAAAIGQWFGRGPVGTTMMRMLEQGNVGRERALSDSEALLGRAPESLAECLAAHPSGVEDRWQASLTLVGPVLRLALALVWIASGVVGLLLPAAENLVLIRSLGLTMQAGQWLIMAVSILDLVLGFLLLVGLATRPVIALMAVSVVAYTAGLGWAAPSLWLEPTGGLLKNVPLLPALWVLWVLESRR